MTDTAETKLERAKLRLILQKTPFFGVLFSYLKLVRVDDPKQVPTMATDGRHLFFSPAFVEKIDAKELEGVLVHEVLHNAFEHHIRRKDRHPKKWNHAADYVINENVLAAGFKLPDGALVDPQYNGMTAEEIYAKLPDPPGGWDAAGAGIGDVIDGAAAHDKAAIEQLRAEQQVLVRQAAAAIKGGKNIGSLPAALQRLLDELTAPKIDWAARLRNMINSLSSPDFTWSKPNKRLLHMGYYFPGTIPNAVGHIVVAVDTSGSIGDDILREFGSEIRGILDDGNCDKITVIYADAAVQSVQEFERGDVLALRPQGGGGTMFSPTFKYIADNIEDPAAIVYLTDLYVSDFGIQPDCPVIWAVTGTKQEYEQLAPKVPFGDPIHISVN